MTLGSLTAWVGGCFRIVLEDREKRPGNNMKFLLPECPENGESSATEDGCEIGIPEGQ
ncbi:MAG: hypothetical protein OHK0012_21920 [Synechococcales cyanobacterium]